MFLNQESEYQKILVALTGDYNSGKTWLLNELENTNYQSSFQNATPAFAFVQSSISPYRYRSEAGKYNQCTIDLIKSAILINQAYVPKVNILNKLYIVFEQSLRNNLRDPSVHKDGFVSVKKDEWKIYSLLTNFVSSYSSKPDPNDIETHPFKIIKENLKIKLSNSSFDLEFSYKDSCGFKNIDYNPQILFLKHIKYLLIQLYYFYCDTIELQNSFGITCYIPNSYIKWDCSNNSNIVSLYYDRKRPTYSTLYVKNNIYRRTYGTDRKFFEIPPKPWITCKSLVSTVVYQDGTAHVSLTEDITVVAGSPFPKADPQPTDPPHSGLHLPSQPPLTDPIRTDPSQPGPQPPKPDPSKNYWKISIGIGFIVIIIAMIINYFSIPREFDEYNVKINIKSILAIKEGWEIKTDGSQFASMFVNQQSEYSKLLVALTGDYNSGKTYLMNNLENKNFPSSYQHATPAFGFVQSSISDYIYMDTQSLKRLASSSPDSDRIGLNTKQCKYWYVDSILHYVIAKEGSEAGNFYNKCTFDLIRLKVLQAQGDPNVSKDSFVRVKKDETITSYASYLKSFFSSKTYPEKPDQPSIIETHPFKVSIQNNTIKLVNSTFDLQLSYKDCCGFKNIDYSPQYDVIETLDAFSIVVYAPKFEIPSRPWIDYLRIIPTAKYIDGVAYVSLTKDSTVMGGSPFPREDEK
ncbi:hypothetical protein ACTFIY_003759 [Dictyostelium cf. discoideum]